MSIFERNLSRRQVLRGMALSAGALATLPLLEACEDKESPLLTYTGHSEAVKDISWSPDNKLIASASDDATVQIWDPSTGEKVSEYIGHAGPVESVAWSPEGKLIASTGGLTSGKVQIWDSITGEKYTEYQPDPYHNSSYGVNVSWSPDGKNLASGGGVLLVHDLDSKETRYMSSKADILAWSPDGSKLILKEMIISFNEGRTGIVSGTSRLGAGSLDSASWSPNGKFIAASGYEFQPDINPYSRVEDPYILSIFDVETQEARILSRNDNSILSVSWSPDGRHVVSAGTDETIQIWDPFSGKRKKRYSGHKGSVLDAVWDSTGSKIASASVDKTVKIWGFRD